MLGTPGPCRIGAALSLRTGWTERGLTCWFHGFCLSGSLFGCCRSPSPAACLGPQNPSLWMCWLTTAASSLWSALHTSRERRHDASTEAEMALCPSQASILQCCGWRLRGQRVHTLSQSHWESATQATCSFIHSQLFTKGRLRARHYCFKDWVRKKTWSLLSGFTTRETHANTPSMHKHKLNSFSLILILLTHNLWGPSWG